MKNKNNLRNFLDEVRLGEHGWLVGFDGVLNDEGIDLKDINLYPKKVQNRVAKKLMKVLKKES